MAESRFYYKTMRLTVTPATEIGIQQSPYATPYELGEALDNIGFEVQDPASTLLRLIARGVAPALTPRDKNGVKGIYYLKGPAVTG
jgi:hypothetical protein